ncbi:hypothetical protein YC2023_084165 [Brassica napus]
MRESWARYHRPFRLKEMNKWVSTREPGLPSEPGFSVSEAISCPSPEPEIFSINSSSESLVNALRKETADEVGREEDVRPPGVKASKAAKRKKHGNEAAFDQIETILAAKNMLSLSKQKILDSHTFIKTISPSRNLTNQHHYENHQPTPRESQQQSNKNHQSTQGINSTTPQPHRSSLPFNRGKLKTKNSK